MEWLFNTVKSALLWLGPTATLVIIVFLGLYIFWKECARSRKNNSSIFDTYLFSVLGGIFLARIVHIVIYRSEYFNTIWYWLPYEKYGDQVYLFRLLPWKLVRVWDGGLDLLYLFIGMILVQTLWVTIGKKWKWSDLFPAIFLSNWAMLGLSFLLLGILWDNNIWVKQGAILFVPYILFLILQTILVNIQKGEKKAKTRYVLQVIFSIISMGSIIYVYFALFDKELFVTIGVAIWILWGILGTIYHIISFNKKANVTIEKVSSVRHVTLPDPNKPVRLFRK